MMPATFSDAWACGSGGSPCHYGTQVTKIKYDMSGKYQVYKYDATGSYPNPSDYWDKDIVVWYLEGTELSETTRFKLNRDCGKDESWSLVVHGDVKICEKDSGGPPPCVFPPPDAPTRPCCEGDLACYEFYQDMCPAAVKSMMSLASGSAGDPAAPVPCADSAALFIGKLKIEQNAQDDDFTTEYKCVTPGDTKPVTFAVDGLPAFQSCNKPLSQFNHLMYHWKLRGPEDRHFYSIRLLEPGTACVKTERGEKCHIIH